MKFEAHDAVVDLLKSVGAFQLTHFRKVDEDAVDMKAAKETVSFVDVESEKLLRKGFGEILPEAGWYGEELGQEGSQDLVWVVDPIDGTTNYLNGLDYFSISIGLMYYGEVVYGIVYRPSNGEWISAKKGDGVMINGEKIAQVRQVASVAEALFVTGFPYRSEDLNDAFFGAANEILRLGRGIRRNGSAALDLAHAGMGWYGGFWESDLQPYDAAGAMAIMQEAGLTLTNHLGEPYRLFKDRILVAATPCVHAPLLAIVKKHYSPFL